MVFRPNKTVNSWRAIGCVTNELTSKPDAVLLGLCATDGPHVNLGSVRVDLRTRLVLELAVDVTLLLLSAGSWPKKEGTSGAWANLGSFRVVLLRRLTVELDVDVTLLLLSSGSWPENDMMGKGRERAEDSKNRRDGRADP